MRMQMTATNQRMAAKCKVGMFTLAEPLQARVELRHHALGYVKSTALRCTVKPCVVDAIHPPPWRRASAEELLTELSLDASSPCLRSVMRLLAALGVFKEGSDGEYRLTAVSSLLVDDDGSGRGSLVPITLLYLENRGSGTPARCNIRIIAWFKKSMTRKENTVVYSSLTTTMIPKRP